MRNPQRWDVYKVPVSMRSKGGRKGDHFVIVVNRSKIVADSALVHVVPVTTDFQGHGHTTRTLAILRKREHPFLHHDSVAVVHYLFRMNKGDLPESAYQGSLSSTARTDVELRLEILFDLTDAGR